MIVGNLNNMRTRNQPRTVFYLMAEAYRRLFRAESPNDHAALGQHAMMHPALRNRCWHCTGLSRNWPFKRFVAFGTRKFTGNRTRPCGWHFIFSLNTTCCSRTDPICAISTWHIRRTAPVFAYGINAGGTKTGWRLHGRSTFFGARGDPEKAAVVLAALRRHCPNEPCCCATAHPAP